MNKTLQKVIIEYIFDNQNDFQLINATLQEFREYIYNSEGEYLIGGPRVANFIKQAIKLIREQE